jgi:HK97 family phage prohead protease
VLRFDERSSDAPTIVVCIAPFREVAVVDDGAGPYKEKIVPGAFRDQVEARSTPLRIWLDLEHQRNSVIGHATGLTELEGGLYGAFAVHPGVVGDKVLDAIRGGTLADVSMKATSIRSREVDGVTHRQEVHLDRVALVADSAYRTKMLGIRKAIRGEQAGPVSEAEFTLWDMERLDGKLRALQMRWIDNALEMRAERRRSGGAGRSYATDPRYQRVTQLRRENAEKRAEIEAAIASPADETLGPRVLHRDCGQVLAVH